MWGASGWRLRLVKRIGFMNAKKAALNAIYADRATTFYCGCSYTPNQSGASGVIDHGSCGYQIKHIESRAPRLEWEHVMPAARFGQGRDCYEHRELFPACFKSNGKLRTRRDCCEKVDAGFKLAHNDLHNLTPSVGEMNADRSDLPYGIVEEEPREYGDCNVPDKWPGNPQLGRWVTAQRRARKKGKLSEHRVRQLNELESQWVSREMKR